MPSVLYNVQGEEGDDSSHPNCFRAKFASNPVVLQDFIAQFPLARNATFHYRFKKKSDTEFGYIWKDVSTPSEPVPLYNGLIWAKVMQTSSQPTAFSAQAVPAAVSRKQSASPKARRPAGATSPKKTKTRKPASKSRSAKPATTPVPDQSASLFGPAAGSGGNSPGAGAGAGSNGSSGSSSKSSKSATATKTINTDGITMDDITLADGFETKSEVVQQAMIQRAKELVAKQREKVKKLKEKDAAAESLKAAKRAAEGSAGAELDKWAKDSTGGLRKIRTLLCELPKVLWSGTKWKPVDMGDVMDPKRVRLVYFKSMRIVHPDKLKADASPEQKVRAERIFDALNNAWKLFQAQEM